MSGNSKLTNKSSEQTINKPKKAWSAPTLRVLDPVADKELIDKAKTIMGIEKEGGV